MTLRQFIVFISLSFVTPLVAQDSIPNPAGDPHYREDQVYVGVTYNLISSVPDAINTEGVSGGIQFGFLRDMPLNDRRNISVALGAGFAFDRMGQTLFIGEDENENTIFRALDDDIIYNSNRFSTASVELPIELRWRTSTPSNTSFWRIYGGVRLGYTYWYRASFKQDGNDVSQTDIPEFEKMRLMANLSFGYGTFNFYMSYSFTPFFKDAFLQETNEQIDFRPVRLGIIFYLL
ncbi:MAG: PorT family protein [Bacteroidetes bacterium]|nr:PorT family protein [Bacteroidota bacterium]